ncbi:uncharacterized protein LOC136712633 [Amia ocellicauda]|uniref:uncharacterized protein LOC136712633 n=1 Tax=Amia ocellicauda TaxID=2972642 RepID=UPI003463BD8C
MRGLHPTSEVLRLCVTLLVLVRVPAAIAESCLLISEINPDNPQHDLMEFVELFHSSGKSASLDGYTLVFYNGNGNTAYKVLDLSSYTTDDTGFFLAGAHTISPKPTIILPPNSVQNGPDAIALYHGDGQYTEGMDVTAEGLVDAIVYKSRRVADGEGLAEVLTPGFPVFLEDESVLEGDESIERCWLSGQSWTFQVAVPSPGRRNPCMRQAAQTAEISELSLGGEVFVELSIPQPSTPLALVFLNGTTATVEFSMDVQANGTGLLLIVSAGSSVKDAVVLPPEGESVLLQQGALSGAVALYSGRAVDFPAGGPVSLEEPLDAFVFWGAGELSGNLTDALTPGRQGFHLTNRSLQMDVSLSRCGVSGWSGDPGAFTESPQTPGQANQCTGLLPCPSIPVSPTQLPPNPSPTDPSLSLDFLLNEVNADTPGAAEDAEFIEIWHPAGRRVSLDGIWLLLFSGHNNQHYRQFSLYGYFTDAQGYFILGSHRMTPQPSFPLPSNMVQNGPDAVALYRSLQGPPMPAEKGAIPTDGLLDAIVYRQRGSDKQTRGLSDALTPWQIPLFEDSSFSSGDESLSRCGSLKPLDLSAFRVTVPTPLKKNACSLASTSAPQPTSAPAPQHIYLSEVASASWTNRSQQESFIELASPPLASLRGLLLVLLKPGHSGPILTLRLTGTASKEGVYLIGNVSGANQVLPVSSGVPHWGAVALYQGAYGVAVTNHILVDALVFSEDQELLRTLALSRGQHVTPEPRSVEGPVSLSCCPCNDTQCPPMWTTSEQTPGHLNLCPSSNFSSEADMCLRPLTGTGKPVSDCESWKQQRGSREAVQREVAVIMEQSCRCGVSELHLQDAKFSCDGEWLQVGGTLLALSAQQMDLILQSSGAHHCSPSITEQTKAGTVGLGWEIGLIIFTLVALGLGAALATYLYRKRRPLNYSTIELNEQGDEAGQDL